LRHDIQQQPGYTKIGSDLTDWTFMGPQWLIPPVKTHALRPHKYGRWAVLGLGVQYTGRKEKGAVILGLIWESKNCDIVSRLGAQTQEPSVSLGFGMSGKMSGDRVRRQVPQCDNVTAPRSFVSIIY